MSRLDIDGLTNYELVKIGKINDIDIKINNIMMVDEIIKIKKSGNYIINLEKRGKGGSHWIALLVRNKKWCYIDSFGAFPSSIILKHCKNNNFNLGYSNYICQAIRSTRCGIYSLQAIKYLQYTNSNNIYDEANLYVNNYEPDEKNNEKIVMLGMKLL